MVWDGMGWDGGKEKFQRELVTVLVTKASEGNDSISHQVSDVVV